MTSSTRPPVMPTVTVVLLLMVLHPGTGFNLSPEPNYVFHEPALTMYMNKVRSSYFGYAINLRKSGVLVGAPQAQSDVPAQRKVNETGAVYRCRFTDGSCEPYYFDRLGNTHQEQSDFAYNSEKKDHQMLGASMDGHGADGDRFVVCAPKMISELTEYYLLHGVCYVADGTESDEPKDMRKVAPLRAKNKQLHKDAVGQYYYYMYGEQGISVHITDDGEEILMGAPGVFNWRGTVVRFRRRITDDSGGLSRRDSSNGNPRPTNRHKRQIVNYVSDVPNPYFNRMQDDSYFGFAVSSGRFLGPDQKLLYVASAPQSNDQVGEVLIFDIVNADSAFAEAQIKVHFTIPGQQQGEYFGYSLLTEDFNGDGFPDLAIGAPMHSRTGDYETGTVYVYWISEGQLNFRQQIALTVPYEQSGRFGTSLAKLGDINMDGYNDIAIGAPFEGDGVVYVFLGSDDGLQSKPSQRLTAPANELRWPGKPMFGHAISRGTDIDGNGFPDLAIGAPNSETVYVYRSYPVLRIEADVTSSKRELSIEDTTFELTVCLTGSFTAGRYKPVELSYSLSADAQMGRVTLLGGSGSANRRNGTISLREDSVDQCQQIEARLKATSASIYRPVILELAYELLSAPPATELAGAPFCEDCALLDPNEPVRLVRKVSFKTGCRSEVCVSDLQLSARWLDIDSEGGYILGSTKKASLEYTVYNAGENAYLPQLNVTLVPSRLTLAKLTSECRQTVTTEGVNVLCDLNNGLPLKASYTAKYTLVLDMTKLEGGTVSMAEIRAEALSTSEESVPMDNFYETTLPLREFSEIEIIAKSSVADVSLEKQKGLLDIEYELNLHNNGPSVFRNLEFTLDVPLVYHKPSSGGQKYKMIDINAIDVSAYYSYKTLDYSWTQNGVDLLPNPIEHGSIVTQSPTVDVDTLHRQSLDYGILAADVGPQWGNENDGGQGHDTMAVRRRRRRRRDLSDQPSEPQPEQASFKFNRYTNRLVEQQSGQQSSALTSVLDKVLLELPGNRTLLFSCIDDVDSYAECARLTLAVDLFRPGNVPIAVKLSFKLDLDAVESAFHEREDIFALLMMANVQQKQQGPGGAGEQPRFKLARNNPYTVVYRFSEASTPVWVYIVSGIAGLLVLVVLSYGLYKLGFFERTKKEEMEKHQRESVRLNAPAPSSSSGGPAEVDE
ncbi:integrin alpha-PS3-like [Anopheles aquasalis]|uniref:integrin alpha-PS3-like n=1 Tax=Anopheles aquasalis TaxID=42839 RepID=UPI00215A5B48|nr:integrin alpha-PS3-like [Anopheles aquasalis]XP_050085656.1 integrin alpha-PS3-like [Anopheles aquasalis]XP_050085657.1 integrin alpha-PS3-like [Anopheles aquasalis]XP_050085658.1 integrin alpha-PS3-like [Anopheles aquasalis]